MFKQKGRCFNVDLRSRDRRKRKDIDNTLRLKEGKNCLSFLLWHVDVCVKLF